MPSINDYFYKGPVIQLNCGRLISMQNIDQWLTYAHILEGFPWGPRYAGTVNLHQKWVQQRHPYRQIIVLEPRLRPLGISDSELERTKLGWQNAEKIKARARQGIELSFDEICDSEYPEPVCIGNVCCSALFESKPTDTRFMLSELHVIWFQDGFALPIDPLVIQQMKNINWEGEAANVDL